MLPPGARHRRPATRVLLTEAVVRSIEQHAVRELPNECCGFLLGRWQDGSVRVSSARAAHNVERRSPQTRYAIDPDDVLRALRTAEGEGIEVVGFYHSHPTGAISASEVDRERAWSKHVYLIVPVSGGRPGRLGAWEYPGAGDRPRPLPVEVRPEEDDRAR